MFSWLENLLRNFSFFLDGIVYGLISAIYDLFLTISNIAIIGHDTINEFTQRIYILIGIFMIFKITVSMISWYANPDSISDSKSGSGALIKRIVISLVCLAVVPWIFTFAYRIQYVILNENIIGNLVLAGMTSADPNEVRKNGGSIMAIRTFQAFFYPDEYQEGDDYDIAMKSTSWTDTKKFVAKNLTSKPLFGDYKYHYQAFISTIAGGVVAVILLIFCVDIAIRSVKLAFLQLIAPVPVLSYIDEKKGDKIFNNWVSECVSTYLDVFIRLLVIYFAIFLISEVSANFFSNGFSEYGPDGNIIAGSNTDDFFMKAFAQAFIIIGILLFAKQLPDLLKNILGIKSGSKFTLNPIGKALGIGLAAGGAGAVGGFAANLIAGKGLGSALAGAASAGSRSMYGGFTSGGKKNPFSVAKSGIDASNAARYQREIYKKQGYGYIQRFKDRMDEFAGAKNSKGGVGKFDSLIKDNNAKIENNNSAEQALRNAQSLFVAEHPNENFDNLQSLLNEKKFLKNKLSENANDDESELKLGEVESKINSITDINKPNSDVYRTYMKYTEEIDRLDAETMKLKSENKSMQNVLDIKNNKNKKDKK